MLQRDRIGANGAGRRDEDEHGGEEKNAASRGSRPRNAYEIYLKNWLFSRIIDFRGHVNMRVGSQRVIIIIIRTEYIYRIGGVNGKKK